MVDASQLPSKAPANDEAAEALTAALERLNPLQRNSSMSRRLSMSKASSPQNISGGNSNALSITSSLAGSPTSGTVLPPSGAPTVGTFATPGMGMTMTMTDALPSPVASTTAGGADAGDDDMTAEEARARSAPASPHFGAHTGMLRILDESTKVVRQSSNAPTRAPSVSGIGNLVEKPDYSEAKIVVAMVGLPARGKSFLSNRLMRYLKWLEYKVKVFNVGQMRRSKARDLAAAGAQKEDHSANYFSHSNAEASALREKLATDSLDQLIDWLKKEGNVGIHDATNSTRARRDKIRERVAQEPDLQLLFLESYCDDPDVIAANIKLKVSSGDPDYAHMSREEAEADFRKRIAEYERVYETLTETNLSYCKIFNVGKQVTINRINGYLQSRIAFYLMNLHLKPRSIYLSRHGESMYNVAGLIGGDSPLSKRGEKYAAALPELILKNIGDAPLTVWTSTLQRTQATARFLPYPKKTWKSLDELDAGVCDGMTYEQIQEQYPEDYESRDDDKYNYRYRGGESYRDVVVRLEPVIMELERQENILIIGHQAILRCLYAYFKDIPLDQLPYINVPLHTLIKLTPMAYGCAEERFPLPIPAVDTHRERPHKAGKGAASFPPLQEPTPLALDKASLARDYFGDAGADVAPSASLTKLSTTHEEDGERGHETSTTTTIAK